MAHTKVTKTYSQNNGTANTFSYSGSFDVFKATEVEVELDNVALTYTASTINESASPREYTVDTTAKTIHIGGADLSSGSVVIQPVTDMGAPTPRATYTPGASITSEDLNNNQKQLMRKAMEYDEQKLSSRGGTMTGDLTMGEDKVIIFEGATDNAYETTLTVVDPTADRTITLPNITGTVLTTADTGTVTSTILAANSVDSSELVDGSIDSSHISSSAVTTDKIAADAVTGAKIADDAIDSEHYTDGSIDTAHIGNSQITTAKIANANITHDKLAEPCVQAENVGNGTLTGIKIADNQIDSRHYIDGSIDTEHIADSQVTTAKIAADAITGAKIADDAIDSEHYTDGSIDTAHIGDSQVTTAKIADANVTTAKLATDAVTTVKITDANVTTAKIAADAITGAKIADDAINSEHYTDGSIDTAHIADSNVTTAKIADANVTTAKITDANVTTAKIANDAITIAKIGCEQTTISDSDSHVPTSGAVVDYVAAQIAPIGGLEVIADEDNFPSTQPASGVVISISDAGGVVVNGSGTSTTARTAGNGSDNVTINNFPSDLQSTTLAAGVGLMVTSTGSSNTYNYHKALLKEADLKNLSNDIDDFGNRYRVHAGEPSSNNDDGDMVWDTNANKMKVYDATASSWTEVTSTGDFKFLVPVDAGTTTAATWDGSDTSFDLKETTNSGSAASVSNVNQLIISLNGVIQKPNTGTYSASEEGFYLTDSDTIRFCTAPPSGSTAFILQIGSAVSIPTPGDGTVTTAKIASAAVTTAKIAKPLDFADDEKARFGTGNDLEVYHNGTSSYIANSNGTLMVTNTAGNNIRLRSDNIRLQSITDTEDYLRAEKDGAVELYHNNVKTFQTEANGATFMGPEGSAGWIQIFSDEGDDNGDKWRLIKEGGNENFSIQNYKSGSWETNIVATGDGAVGLYYDNSKKTQTYSDGLEVLGDFWINNQTNAGKDIWFDESSNTCKFYTDVKAAWGTGNELQIHHDDTDSWINNTSGKLYIKSTTFVDIRSDGDETMIKATPNGAVELYYDNVKFFETTGSGSMATFSSNDTSMPPDKFFEVRNTDTSASIFAMTKYNATTDSTSGGSWWYVGAERHGSGTGSQFGIWRKDNRLFYGKENGTMAVSSNFGDTDRDEGQYHLVHSDKSSAALVVENSHDSSPYGILVDFSDDSPDNASYYFYKATDGGDTNRFTVWADGDVDNHDNSYSGFSDVKLKENIVDAKSQWADIKAVKVRNFNFKTDGPSKKRLGVVAQEIETICPSLVVERKDIDDDFKETGTTTKSVKYSVLYMKAIKALQEAMEKIETLETKVAALEAK